MSAVLSITSPFLMSLPGISHGFFTRQGGVSEGLFSSLNCRFGMGDQEAHVQENRTRVQKTLGSKVIHVLTVQQVHEAHVVTVTKPWLEKNSPTADALVTRWTGLPLGILTADCGPVLFADPEARVIGAAHAGWRGAFLGVLEKTLEAMEKEGAVISRIQAVLGPCIAAPSYEVDQKFYQDFLTQDTAHDRYFVKNAKERYQFDLPAYILFRLNKAGVGAAVWTGHDTCAQEDLFFSHRRSTLRQESASGRQMSAIMLKD